MKGLFILGAIMLLGITLMFVCLYKFMSALDEIKAAGSEKDAQLLKTEVQPYILGSYVGVTLFAGGALGAIILLFRSWTRR